MTAVRDLARQERADFADLLNDLTPQEWSAPSSCAGWTVRDVAVHTLAYLGQSRAGLLVGMVRAGFDVDRLNARGLGRHAALKPHQLVELMRKDAEPYGAAALYGGRVALIECLIHQQDIRRPLLRLRSIPEERLRICLNYARISPVISGVRRTRGVRLTATDMDWSAGRGPEVRGSAEALLLTMTGRVATVSSELAGDGTAFLR